MGTYEGLVARHLPPPLKVGSMQQNGRTILADSYTFIHGAGDGDILKSSYLHLLTLDVKLLGPNTSLFSSFALFPCYHPLSVRSKSDLSSPGEVVSKVLSV